MSRRKLAFNPAVAKCPYNTRLTRDGKPLLNIRLATTFFARLRGLLGHRQPGPDEALLIKPCGSIHTYGMSYTINVAFLDKIGQVLALAIVKPSSTASCKESVAVVEMAEGTVDRLLLKVGHKLLLEDKQWY